MNSFYNIVDKIKDVITAEPFNNEMTFEKILLTLILKKQSLFPLAHLTINNATINENFVNFNMTIFFYGYS